jgi:NTE family protein
MASDAATDDNDEAAPPGEADQPVEPASVSTTFDPADPSVVTQKSDRGPREGVALCLSGGGSRAMLYHAGALLRLAEVGELEKVKCISSVSGGSITAGALARCWVTGGRAPTPAEIKSDLIVQLLELSSEFMDIPAFLVGTFLPRSSPGAQLSAALDKKLFDGLTLGQLPGMPDFVINATNLGTGVLWKFTKGYVGEYQVGGGPRPNLRVADAVAASSAFPPFFAPFTLRFGGNEQWPKGGTLPAGRVQAFRREAHLGDGGIYDNLGLETAWKQYTRVFVSDGGGTYKRDPNIKTDFIRLSIRVTSTIDHQVRSLRLRQIVESYKRGEKGLPGGRTGALWTIRTAYAEYPDRSPDIVANPGSTEELALVKTHMRGLHPTVARRLVNWGYATCDAALRSYVKDITLDKPVLPFAADGI